MPAEVIQPLSIHRESSWALVYSPKSSSVREDQCALTPAYNPVLQTWTPSAQLEYEMWPRFFSKWTSELHVLSTCEVYKAVLSAARALLVQDGSQPCTWHEVGEPGTCVELKGISEHWAFSVSCPEAAPDGTGSSAASHIQLFLEAELQLDLLPKMKRKGIIHLRFALQCLAQIWFLRKGWQSTDTGKNILRYSLMTIDWARFLYSYRSHENNHWTAFLVAKNTNP